MAFDIAAALGDISRKTDGRKQIRYIPLHMIDTNPRNFYSTEGIDDLAENIRMVGLLDPLIVREGVGGRYMLISGHRRRLALKKIAEEAANYPESMHDPVACIVETDNAPLPGIEPGGDDELRARQLVERLKLIYANADTRVMSSADTARQVRELRELFTELRDMGYQFPGKIRDHVAAAAKVSATRVARLDVIEKGLAEPTLRKAWKDGTLGETSAYEIARRPKDVQKTAAERVGVGLLQGMTTEQVTNCLDACEADGNRDREAREDWNRNVTAMAEADGNGKTFDADAYIAQREKEDAVFLERLEEVADTLYDGLEYVTDRREGIEFLKRKHGVVHHGGTGGDEVTFQAHPKGLTLEYDFDDGITRTWTEVFDALALAALRNAANRKRDRKPEKVSAADTGIELQAGTPTESGEYMTRAGVGSEETPQTAMWQRLEWHALEEVWCFPKTGAPLPKGTNVFRWFKLPEV